MRRHRHEGVPRLLVTIIVAIAAWASLSAALVTNDSFELGYVSIVSGPGMQCGYLDLVGNIPGSRYQNPVALHYEDANQYLAVADYGNRMIRFLNLFSQFAATPMRLPTQPVSVSCTQKCAVIYAAGADNVIYATTYVPGQTKNAERLVGVAGSVNFSEGFATPTLATPQAAQFASLASIVRDRPATTVWFSDRGAGVIGAVNLLTTEVLVVAGDPTNRTIVDGNALTMARLGVPAAIAMSPTLHVIYFVDQHPNRTAYPAGGVLRKLILSSDAVRATPGTASRAAMLVVTLAGSWTEQAATYATGPLAVARFSFDRGGITCDPSGTLVFVTNDVNNVIQAFNLTSGVVSAAAGPLPPSTASGQTDGFANTMLLDRPTGLTYSWSQGFILFVEPRFCSIRRVATYPTGQALFVPTKSPSQSNSVPASVSESGTRSSLTKTRTRGRTRSKTPTARRTASLTQSRSSMVTESRSLTPAMRPTPSTTLTDSNGNFTPTTSDSVRKTATMSLSYEFATRTDSTSITPPPSPSRSGSVNASTWTITVTPPPTRTPPRTPTRTKSTSPDTTRSLSARATHSVDITPSLPTRTWRIPTPSKPRTDSGSLTSDATMTTTRPRTRSQTRTKSKELPHKIIYFAPNAVIVGGMTSAVAVGTLGALGVTSFALVPAATDVQLMLLMSRHACFRGAYGTTFDDVQWLARTTSLLDDAALSPVQSLAVAVAVPLGIVLLHAAFTELVVRLCCVSARPDGTTAAEAEGTNSRRLRRARLEMERRFKGHMALNDAQLPPRSRAHALARFPAASIFAVEYLLPTIGYDTAKQLWYAQNAENSGLGTVIFGSVVAVAAISGIIVTTLGRLGSGGKWAPFDFIFDHHAPLSCVRQYVLPRGGWMKNNYSHRFGSLFFFAPRRHPPVARLVWPLRAFVIAAFCATQQRVLTSEGCHMLGGLLLLCFCVVFAASLWPRVLRTPMVRWTEAASNGALALVALCALGDGIMDASGPVFGFISVVTVPSAAVLQSAVVAWEELVWRPREAQLAAEATPEAIAARRNKNATASRSRPNQGSGPGGGVNTAQDGQPCIILESSSDSDAAVVGAGAAAAVGVAVDRSGHHLGSPLLLLPEATEHLSVSPWLAPHPLAPARMHRGREYESDLHLLRDPVHDLRTPGAQGRADVPYWVPAFVPGAPREPEYGMPLFFFDAEALGTATNAEANADSSDSSAASARSRTRKKKAKRSKKKQKRGK